MARPNRPHWHPHSGRYRCTIAGQLVYFPRSIGRYDKPLRDDIPLKAWEFLDHSLRQSHHRASLEADPTLLGLAEAYLQWVEGEADAGRVVRAQYRSHAVHLAHFLDYSGLRDTRARLVTADQVDEFFGWFRGLTLPKTKKTPSGHFVHNVGKSIRAMMRWAARPVKGREPARLLNSNPLEGYKFPSQPGAVRGHVEGAAVRRFLRWAWARARREPRGSLKRRFDRIFVLVLRFQRLTGCRPGEAVGLEWAEIHPPPGGDGRWEPRTIVVRQEKVTTRKQTDRARVIHVSRPVARLLRAIERLEGRHPEYVFTHMRGRGSEARGELDPVAGEPWPDGAAASQKVAKLRHAAIAEGVEGVEGVGARKMVACVNRHAYASEGSSLGFSDEQIAEQLGNTPQVMQRVYAHTVAHAAAERAEQIAERRRRVVGRRGRGMPPAEEAS